MDKPFLVVMAVVLLVDMVDLVAGAYSRHLKRRARRDAPHA